MNQKIIRIGNRLLGTQFNLVLAAVVCLLSAPNLLAQSTTNAVLSEPPKYQADWRWVKGAVFVPTSCVNEAQQWDEYDPVINDRELHYASVYVSS